ncbi:MAG TPA: TIGR03086 family metal-binding protein [Actinomycetota bacterium]|jgi:uncharacterized protein (TIGR03086 family)|nr:TIGR03086 family metal-binding protein [Actinomycetota bacterium]
MDAIERIEKATQRTSKIVHGVKAEQYAESTPCTEFDVKALLNHMIGGLEMLRTGAEGGEAKMPEGDQFGAEPGKEYDERAAKLLEVIRQPGTIDKPWKMPFGELPGQMMASIAFVEHVTHGWDLAKATGQDTTIPDDLIAECRSVVEPMDTMWRMDGVLHARVDVPEGASETEKYAGFMGRQP